MERKSALILSIVCFIIFALITYYGASVTLWSSVVFGLFVSLILLNLFYPVSQATTDDADYSLVLYAAFEIFGIVLLAIYITQKSLSDIRISNEISTIEYTYQH